MKRIYAACLTASLLLTASMLPGCSLIPQEENLPQMPVVEDIPETVLETIPVLRGELIEEKIFNCSFQPMEEEKLYFKENGQPIAAVYVKAGDEVKAGDLLAELDNAQIHQRIDTQQHAIDSLKLKIAQEQNFIAVQKERITVLKELAKEDTSYSSRIASAEAALESRNSQLTYLFAQLSVENSALEELNAALQNRQIYAGIDGTVSYALDLGSSTVYSKNQQICTIQDLSGASFVGTFKEGLLEVGQEQLLTTDDGTVETVVSQITPADDKGNCTVSFTLITPNASLKAGTGARLTLIANHLEDTLYLPNSAIHTQNDVSFVYYPDENGIISVKAVETGLRIGGNTQIISGLHEGDVVLEDAP